MSEKKPWYKKWWGIAGIVIAGLMILGALAGPPEEPEVATQPVQEAAVEETTTTLPSEVIGSVGKPLMVGEVEWTVKSAKKAKSLGSEFMEANANGVFIVVELTATMRGKEEGTVDDQQLKINDDKGRTFSASGDGSVAMAMGDKWIFLKQINPDVTISGAAVFDIPKDAKGLTLQIDDLRLLSDDKGKVKLGL